MIKIYTFLTTMFEHDFQCSRITLRARKALRVISDEMWLWPTRRARFAGDSTRRNRGCLGCLEGVEGCLECLERVLGGVVA